MKLRGWVRRVFLHNLPLKVMSLVLSTGLWYAVSREPVSEVEVSVPVEFRNVPENLEIGSEHIPQAEIRVRGPARIVRDLKPADIRAEIDLAGAQTGERTFDLSGRHIRTLQEYLLVSQKEPRIEQFLRQPDARWLLNEAAGLETSLELPSLRISISLAEVFAKVNFVAGPIRSVPISAH